MNATLPSSFPMCSSSWWWTFSLESVVVRKCCVYHFGGPGAWESIELHEWRQRLADTCSVPPATPSATETPGAGSNSGHSEHPCGVHLDDMVDRAGRWQRPDRDGVADV